MPAPSAIPRLAITLGDPGGIGPEIIVKALAEPELRHAARFVVLGLSSPLDAAAAAASVDLPWTRIAPSDPLPDDDIVLIDYEGLSLLPSWPRPWLAQPNENAGRVSLAFVEHAIVLAKSKKGHPSQVCGVVTAPISKEAWFLAGEHKFPGHTELFAARFGVQKFRMMFVSPKLRVVLQTVHVPLRDAPRCLTDWLVRETIELGHDACKRLGIASPRIAVCGVNPHAGENGLIGQEEERYITPAIAQARAAGIDASGPHPGDTIFNAAARGDYDLVIAMYHDQGLIPVKLLGWQDAVNLTVGLPTIRTSPDHGTAFDIAGKNKADPGSMKAAIRLAVQLAASERSTNQSGAKR